MINSVKGQNGIPDGEYDDVVEFDDEYNIQVKGKLPTSGEITISKGKVTDATICIGGYTVSYDGSKASVQAKCNGNAAAINDGLLYKISKTKFTNNTVVNITSHGKTYTAHVYNVDGDTTLTGENVYGTSDDVATADREAVNMVILKVNGNLTINSGATVRPYYTEYGGPKGFIIYVTGTLTNNGTIDNSHGAKATGEDVYLWKNSDGTYETVPAIGGLGAGAASTTGDVGASGSNGTAGANRKTGGGGSGAATSQYGLAGVTRTSGRGGNGTSYSGGAGGASISVSANCNLYAASDIGGTGGSTIGENGCTSYWEYYVYGGAGNPGGDGHYGGAVNHTYDGPDGTGGLLVIYASEIDNKATIKANGTDNIKTSAAYQYSSAGSGAGSINIFYNDSYASTGTISATGGKNGTSGNAKSNPPGSGGNGSITIGSIKTKSFVLNN